MNIVQIMMMDARRVLEKAIDQLKTSRQYDPKGMTLEAKMERPTHTTSLLLVVSPRNERNAFTLVMSREAPELLRSCERMLALLPPVPEFLHDHEQGPGAKCSDECKRRLGLALTIQEAKATIARATEGKFTQQLKEGEKS